MQALKSHPAAVGTRDGTEMGSCPTEWSMQGDGCERLQQGFGQAPREHTHT